MSDFSSDSATVLSINISSSNPSADLSAASQNLNQNFSTIEVYEHSSLLSFVSLIPCMTNHISIVEELEAAPIINAAASQAASQSVEEMASGTPSGAINSEVGVTHITLETSKAPEQFIFMENQIYCDTSFADPILEWCESLDTDIDHAISPLSTTSWKDTNFKLNTKYLFLHHQDCPHLFKITTKKVIIDESNDLFIQLEKIVLPMCVVCKLYQPQYRFDFNLDSQSKELMKGLMTVLFGARLVFMSSMGPETILPFEKYLCSILEIDQVTLPIHHYPIFCGASELTHLSPSCMAHKFT